MDNEDDSSNDKLVPLDNDNDYEEDSEEFEAPQEALSEVIKPLVPVMERYFEHQARVSEQQMQLQQQQLELSKTHAVNQLDFAKTRLNFEQHKYDRQFILLALVLVSILAAAGFLIWRDNVSAALILLSHVAALFAGWIGGSGWEKSKREPLPKQ